MEGKQNPNRIMEKFSCRVLDIMLRHKHSEWVEVGGMETVFLGTEEGKVYTVHSRTGGIVMWLCGRDGAFRISVIISISLSCGGRGEMRPSQCVQGRRTWAKPQCRRPLPPPVVSSLPLRNITLEEQVREEARWNFCWHWKPCVWRASGWTQAVTVQGTIGTCRATESCHGSLLGNILICKTTYTSQVLVP